MIAGVTVEALAEKQTAGIRAQLDAAKAEIKSLTEMNMGLVQDVAELQEAQASDAGKPLSKG